MKSLAKTGIALLIALVFGCASKSRDMVVVIEKTKSYHTEDCFRVFMARTKEMPRQEAKSRNLTPCPYCKPDSVSSGKVNDSR